ncbi:MAG TPA: DUF445 family protein [Gemmatimonadaceae bacterium]|nr:DUF445 family protein [Gemmatimonadaceae bacterium]
MPSSETLLHLGMNVLAGMIAGGVTNWIAVWMLFHPYERRFGLQGAIPKNKPRLAKSIGRTVGERLLTPADVMDELRRANVLAMLQEQLARILADILETERGSVRDLLPPGVLGEVERALGEAAPLIAARVADSAASPEFERGVRAFVARTRSELDEQPIGSVLTPVRRAELAARAAAWAEEVATSPELERGVREYIERHAGDLLTSPAPLIERVPVAVVRALEGAIDSYLPLAVAKVGEFLHNPGAREKIREALHDIFQRFVDDLRFHERVIARLMVTERTFETALDAIERDGVEQLAALLDDPVVRDEISKTIHEAILSYLHRPIGEVIGGPESERAQALVRTTGDYLLRILRDERTRGFMVAKLDAVLERAEHRTWGEMLSPVSDEAIAGWILEGARSTRIRELAAEGIRKALLGALDRPIGRPGRWLPGDTAARLSAVITPALWDWGQGQLPSLIERLNVQDMVERKVLGFSTQRVEEIIRGVTERELRLIVRLGVPLGGTIGLLGFLLPRIFGLAGGAP